MADWSHLHLHDLLPEIDLALHLQILESCPPEVPIGKRLRATCNRTYTIALTKQSFYAGIAHLMVAYWVDLELHVGVEEARRPAYRA